MKKKNYSIIWLIEAFILLTPWVVGTLGFWRMGQNIFDALYSAFQCYGVNISAESGRGPYNNMVEICRWTAPVVMLLIGISIIADGISGRLLPKIITKLPGKIAVYGSDDAIARFGMSKKSICSRYCYIKNREYVRCKRYLLLFNTDSDALNFYAQNLQPYIDKKKRTVYMYSDGIERQNIQDENFKMFDINTCKAEELFSSEKWIEYATSIANRKSRIDFIGEGDLCKKLVKTALLLNLVSKDQCFEYHIWKQNVDMSETIQANLAKHMEIDTVVFEKEDWKKHIDEIATSQCVFICDCYEKTLIILNDLLEETNISGTNCRIYVNADKEVLKLFQIEHFAVSEDIKKDIIVSPLLINNNRLKPISQLSDRDYLDRFVIDHYNIEKDGELEHEKYVDEEKKKKKDSIIFYGWTELNSFLRCDNCMNVLYNKIRNSNYLKGTDTNKLEHVRWRRNHALNGWRYAENRNDALKTHDKMVDYEILSEEDKRKDG